MAEVGGKIRLFVTADLGPGAEVPLDAATGALSLRGDAAGGRGAASRSSTAATASGSAEVVEAGRRGGRLVAREPARPQRRPPDLWLLFAPIKKARTDFIVEKATELGVARIQPVFTRLTNAERLRPDRLRAHAIEAAEQCGETCVPEVAEPVRLGRAARRLGPGAAADVLRRGARRRRRRRRRSPAADARALGGADRARGRLRARGGGCGCAACRSCCR